MRSFYTKFIISAQTKVEQESVLCSKLLMRNQSLRDGHIFQMILMADNRKQISKYFGFAFFLQKDFSCKTHKCFGADTNQM